MNPIQALNLGGFQGGPQSYPENPPREEVSIPEESRRFPPSLEEFSRGPEKVARGLLSLFGAFNLVGCASRGTKPKFAPADQAMVNVLRKELRKHQQKLDQAMIELSDCENQGRVLVLKAKVALDQDPIDMKLLSEANLEMGSLVQRVLKSHLIVTTVGLAAADTWEELGAFYKDDPDFRSELTAQARRDEEVRKLANQRLVAIFGMVEEMKGEMLQLFQRP